MISNSDCPQPIISGEIYLWTNTDSHYYFWLIWVHLKTEKLDLLKEKCLSQSVLSLWNRTFLKKSFPSVGLTLTDIEIFFYMHTCNSWNFRFPLSLDMLFALQRIHWGAIFINYWSVELAINNVFHVETTIIMVPVSVGSLTEVSWYVVKILCRKSAFFNLKLEEYNRRKEGIRHNQISTMPSSNPKTTQGVKRWSHLAHLPWFWVS